MPLVHKHNILMLSLISQKLKNALKSLHKRIQKSIKTRYVLHSDKAVPDYLYIEPTNICNANCIFCAYQYDERPKAFMPKFMLQQAVSEYRKAGGKRVGLTPFAGEIFVDKEIIEKVKLIKGKFESIHTYSNASMFHKFTSDDILQSGITHLYISTAPLDEELYKKIYRNNLYQVVLANLARFLFDFHASNEKVRTVQNIEISFRADRSLGECVALRDYIKYIKPHVYGSVTVSSMTHYDSWTGMIKPGDLLDGMTLLRTLNKGKMPTCRRIFNVQMLVNGDIRLCGCRYDNSAEEDELLVGNISTTSLIEAYNSPKAKGLIKSFQSGCIPNICSQCSWYEK